MFLETVALVHNFTETLPASSLIKKSTDHNHKV